MFARKHLFLLFIFGAGLTASGQSTLGSIFGAVHDPQGALVSNATVTLHRQQSNTDRTARTGQDGQYTALNLDPGTYSVETRAAGFATATAQNLSLDARQQLHFDIQLSIAGKESITVNATDAGTIDTDNAGISAALSPEAVLDLPANYRGAGSTSPLNVIQTLPGVQPDSGSFPPSASASPNASIKFSIQGGLPSQSETTVDGISAQNQTTNNIQSDAFPSAESIAEIRVDGVNNNAEYGQPGEITTVTKAGTDHYHGSLFWYFQNSAFDATPFGSASKPKKVANDFGANVGGPIPGLTRGRYKTFGFGTYEGLRFPQAQTVQYVVPTILEKQGNFSQEVATLTNPFTGAAYPNASLIPNPSAAALLSLYPDPNINVGESVQGVLSNTSGPTYNYVANKRNDITSNQFDARLDEAIGSRSTLFARFTSKQISQTVPETLAIPNGTQYAHYRIFATAFSFALTPNLVNEARFGFTLEGDGTGNPLNGAALTNAAGFNGIQKSFPYNGIPFLGFQQITSNQTNVNGSRLAQVERSRVFQYVDNLTWQRGAHTLRFGGDIRHLSAYTPLSINGFGDNYGTFFFNQSQSFTGNEFADFLAGVPFQTETDTVTSDNNGATSAYALYAQDTWKTTSNLNLSFGLRYELHPGFHALNGDIGNFDPSVPKSGTFLYPAGYANLLSVPELAGFNACATAGVNNPAATNATVNGAPCTPVLTNTQAGLPAALRSTPRLRLEPRFGLAYRPFGTDKVAIRGGVGYYNVTTSGALFYALTGALQSNLQIFYNSVMPGKGPLFSFPNVSAAAANAGNPIGSGTFYTSVDTNWHDPYSLQTNLSVDTDLGHDYGLRVSYIGLKTWHLVWQPNLNMLQPSTTTLATTQPRSAFPFPNFFSIESRNTEAQAVYHSGQIELSHRFAHGYSFDTAYTLAKNLSDDQGTYGSFQQGGSFVDEQGGYYATDSYNRHLDYGNVTGTRRNRWLTTGVYRLPVGQGKRFAGAANRFEELAVGGWQLSGIFLLQSGPYLTAYVPSNVIDPSGTGSGTLFGRQQRPDRIGSSRSAHRSASGWFNKDAFSCPGTTIGIASLTEKNGVQPCTVGATTAPIGRFGTESLGDLEGPGTVSLSTGLSKDFAIREGVKLRAEGTFTNILNHTNLADPNLDVTNPSFGVISQARGSDFGGNRTGQVSVKLEF